jgi:ribonuclease G
LNRDLVIAVGPGEWRAALVEDREIAELYVERGDRRPAASIHLGRVVRIAGSLDSAFVEIGDKQPGLAPLREAAQAGVALDEGGRVLVQIRREAQRDKGARLSTRLALPPGLDGAALAARAAGHDPPAQLSPALGFATALALAVPSPPERIVVDDPAAVAELRGAFPEAEISPQPSGELPADLDRAFDRALAPRLDLAGGGRVRFAETHAAIVVDVDTGTPLAGSAPRTALAANLEAARLIAGQARLRNLGGGIVVDFVGLDGRGPRERVRQELEAALAADPARPQVLGWTRLGHIEIVRPYRSRSLAVAMLDATDAAELSAATLAFAALRALAREARARPASDWRIVANPAVAAALHAEAAGGLASLEARLARRIEIAIADDRDQVHPFAVVPR